MSAVRLMNLFCSAFARLALSASHTLSHFLITHSVHSVPMQTVTKWSKDILAYKDHLRRSVLNA